MATSDSGSETGRVGAAGRDRVADSYVICHMWVVGWIGQWGLFGLDLLVWG